MQVNALPVFLRKGRRSGASEGFCGNWSGLGILLAKSRSWLILGGMSEIANFVHRGTAAITPNILKGVHKKLPFLKLKFTEFDDPAFPHLTDQLEFLADVVEDFAE